MGCGKRTWRQPPEPEQCPLSTGSMGVIDAGAVPQAPRCPKNILLPDTLGCGKG